MSVVEQQILVGVAVILIASLVVGAAKFALKSFACLKNGQIEINDTCQTIALTLKGFEGRFAQGEQWMEMHSAADEKAFAAIQQQHREIQKAINDCAIQHRRD